MLCFRQLFQSSVLRCSTVIWLGAQLVGVMPQFLQTTYYLDPDPDLLTVVRSASLTPLVTSDRIHPVPETGLCFQFTCLIREILLHLFV